MKITNIMAKKVIHLTESELLEIIKEVTIKSLNEMDGKHTLEFIMPQKGQKMTINKEPINELLAQKPQIMTQSFNERQICRNQHSNIG